MTRLTSNTCLSCRYWQFSMVSHDGTRKPGWMIAHGMAACGYGETYRAYPARHECHNGKYERLPENDIAKRAEWLERRKQHGAD